MTVISDPQQALDLALELDKNYPNYENELDNYFNIVLNSHDHYLIFQWAQHIGTHMDECFDELKHDNSYMLYWPRNIKTRQEECFRYYMNNLSPNDSPALRAVLKWDNINRTHSDKIAKYISQSRLPQTASSAVIFAENNSNHMQLMFDTLCNSYDITDSYGDILLMWLHRPSLLQKHDLLFDALINYYNHIKNVDKYLFMALDYNSEYKEKFLDVVIKYGDYETISQWLMQVEYKNNYLLKIELIKNNQVDKFITDYKKNCAASYSLDDFYWNVPNNDYKLGIVV